MKIYYDSFKRRRKIGIGIKPEKPQKIKANPILQALEFQGMLKNKEAKSKNELAKKIGLSRINKISHTIASRELKNLVKKRIFRKIGKGKYLKYELTQDFITANSFFLFFFFCFFVLLFFFVYCKIYIK